MTTDGLSLSQWNEVVKHIVTTKVKFMLWICRLVLMKDAYRCTWYHQLEYMVRRLLHRRHKGSMKMTDEKLSNREERM
jgi:hypothetical protein